MAKEIQAGNMITMRDRIKAMEPQIKKALPSVITPERFTRIVNTALSSTPKLADCTPNSFVGAMMNAAQLGLEPNTPLGQAYLIPYGKEVQFQIGYKGLIDLAHRSGEFASISAHEVKENDHFEYSYGLDPTLIHKPAMKNRGETICYYASYKLVNGGFGFEVMSKEDVEEHKKKFSKAAGSSFSPWKDNFDEMAKKTVLKKVLKYAPIKTEFRRGVTEDETVKNEIDEDMSLVQDISNTIEATAEVVEEKIEL